MSRHHPSRLRSSQASASRPHGSRRHPMVTALVGIPLVISLAFATLIALWLAGVDVPGASASRWFTVTKTANADYTPSPGAPVFLLVVGNDGRTGDTVTRGDAIHHRPLGRCAAPQWLPAP